MQVRHFVLIILVAAILVATTAALAVVLTPDGRTASEKLVLTASDLPDMNATQHTGPFASPHNPALYLGGSDAAESGFSLTVDGWSMDVSCVLTVYNSSSLAAQTLSGMGFDDNYSKVRVGDECFVGGYTNETFGTPYLVRSNIYAVMLEGDTITYFTFRAYPQDGSGPILLEGSEVIQPYSIGDILRAQADKVQLGA